MTIKIKRVKRIAIAVSDLDKARVTYEKLFGIKPFAYGTQEAEHEKYHWLAFEIGEGETTMEFLSPKDDPNLEGVIGRFIKRRGEGLYMVTLETAEGADETVDAIRALGIEPSWGTSSMYDDNIPLDSTGSCAESWQEHYINPKEAHGVLITLATIKKSNMGVKKCKSGYDVPVAGSKKE